MNEISQSDFNIFKAKAISRGKLLDRFRLTMIEVKDHIEDEGDRVYFGSSNHAEALKEVIHEMDALRWERIIAERPEIDPYEECRKLRIRTETAVVALKEAREAFCGMAEWLLHADENEISNQASKALFADCQRQRLELDAVILKTEGQS